MHAEGIPRADRLSRVKSLVATGPVSLEGAVAIAVAAVEAKDWKAARLALEPYLSNTPPARVCRLMARIEAGQNRDAGRAREWLARAARGAPDPVWMAPDGSVSAEWQPMSSGNRRSRRTRMEIASRRDAEGRGRYHGGDVGARSLFDRRGALAGCLQKKVIPASSPQEITGSTEATATGTTKGQTPAA